MLGDAPWKNPHPLERTTELEMEIAIARSFGKWVSEFWELSDVEQKLYRDEWLKKSAKEFYASLPKEDKFYCYSIWWGIRERSTGR